MSPNKATIKNQYSGDAAKREPILESARKAAALTKPWVLPPKGQNPNEPLPETFQSVGSRGVTNLEGRMLMALFPPSTPWFQLHPSAEIRYDPTIPPEVLQEIQQALFLQELTIQSLLESTGLKIGRRKRRSGFRSRKRLVLSQILVTGDTLERLTEDYRIISYRRDQYVTRRDSSGDVLYHIANDKIDPLTLDDDKLAKAELKTGELEKQSASDRMVDMYTRCQWQPRSEVWLVEQEVNDHIIVKSEEPVTPFFSTPFELSSGEDYGRGIVELNIGDLRSLDELEERILDFAGMASKFVPAIDYSSQMRPQDLAKKSGEPIKARVSGGKVQDAGFLTVDKFADFRMVHETATRKGKDLGAAMLLESETQPRGERVTATQIQRVAMELEGALGGLYAPINEAQQVPLLDRTIYQAQRDKLIPSLPDDAVEIEGLTGINALQRETQRGKLLSLTQIVGGMPEKALAKIDFGVLVDVLARYDGIHEPGLIKSQEQMIQEAQEEAAQRLQEQAGGRAIDAAGTIAEKGAEASVQRQQQADA